MKRVRGIAVITLVLCVVGFIASILWNSFGGDYDKYGRVPIPGTANVTLPAGEVDMDFAFHTATNSGGGNVVIPDLSFSMTSPDGVRDPVVKEDTGSSVSVNSAVRIRVWRLTVRDPGTYAVTTDGNMNGYIDPQLTFGKGSGLPSWPPVAFAVLFVISLAVALIAGAHVGSSDTKKVKALARASTVPGSPPYGAPSPTTSSPTTSTTMPSTATPEQEMQRLAQLQQLTDLHTAGTLSDEEYAAAKARLGG